MTSSHFSYEEYDIKALKRSFVFSKLVLIFVSVISSIGKFEGNNNVFVFPHLSKKKPLENWTLFCYLQDVWR